MILRDLFKPTISERDGEDQRRTDYVAQTVPTTFSQPDWEQAIRYACFGTKVASEGLIMLLKHAVTVQWVAIGLPAPEVPSLDLDVEDAKDVYH